ncbi:glutamine synthetase family protein [Candidatus Poribacteria bacterium]
MTTKPVRGMLTLEQLKEKIEAGEIETVVTVFSDMYGRLFGKRITGDFFLEHTAESGMHACDYLLTVDMEMEPIPGYKYASWDLGYGDFHCVLDMETLRQATWLEKSALVICDIYDDEHKLTSVAPRSMLKRQMDAAAEMGFLPQGASELEYFIFDESYGDARAKHYQDLKTFAAYLEDYHIFQGTREEVLNAAARKHLSQSGVPVEFSKGEWGPGQHELNIRYADILTMADRHTIYKQCLKELADERGLSITFMAKFDAALAGSSCHVHISLWNPEGERNLFSGDEQMGPVQGSDTFRWFLGGWIAHARELMPFYAPTVNSYKRYQSSSWAPTKLAWSYDNRTAGFRVVGRGQSLRIESRIPGADVNPYLTYAAALASGLDGIRNQIEPPEIFVGDVYEAADLPQVPRTLREAIDVFEQSDFAREAFGEEVMEHYIHFFKTEQAQFDQTVTDWERKRYFEQI